MNRRDLLKGVAATLGVAACPSIIEAVIQITPEATWQVWYDQWQKDIMSIMVKCWEDQIIYGTSAYKTCDVYPFIEHVDPSTLKPPTERGGLFA